MSEQKPSEKKDGIEVDNLTFDANGEVVGLSDAVLDDVAGGLRAVEGNNTGCGNSANLSC